MAGRRNSGDQPIPVVGRFHGNALYAIRIRAERTSDCIKLIGQPFGKHFSIRFIEHTHHTVVAMQIYPHVNAMSTSFVNTIG